MVTKTNLYFRGNPTNFPIFISLIVKISSKIPSSAPPINAPNGNHVCVLERKSMSPETFPNTPKETSQKKRVVKRTARTITIPPILGVLLSLSVLLIILEISPLFSSNKISFFWCVFFLQALNL
jgi:hypothetical protein